MPSKRAVREKLFQDELGIFLKELSLTEDVSIIARKDVAFISVGSYDLGIFRFNSCWAIRVIPAYGEHPGRDKRLKSAREVREWVKGWVENPKKYYQEAYTNATWRRVHWSTAELPEVDTGYSYLGTPLRKVQDGAIRHASSKKPQALSRKPR